MILVYHHVCPSAARPVAPNPAQGWQFTHSPQALERHVRELERRGWRILSLSDMVRIIRDTGREPDRSAAITFDDGWRDNYEHALPVLRRMGCTATFFPTTDHVHRGADDPAKMTVSQLRELVEAGMTVGGHTRTHPDLTRIPAAQAREEIEGCKADLERLIGRPVDLFAYAAGAFDRSIAEMTRAAGFQAACTVLGPARNDRSTLFWLFRDFLSETMDTPADRYRLSPPARRALEWRVRGRLRRALRSGVTRGAGEGP